MSENTLNLIKENEARWVDLRFTDTRGKEQHVTIPASEVDEDSFEGGPMTAPRWSTRSPTTPPSSCAVPSLNPLPCRATTVVRAPWPNVPRTT